MTKTTKFDHHPVKAVKGLFLDNAETIKLDVSGGRLRIGPVAGPWISIDITQKFVGEYYKDRSFNASINHP